MQRKVIIMVFGVLVILGLAGTIWGSSIAEAASTIWNSCDRGKINCAYPGDCHSYIDTNGDNICDRSQSQPAITTSTTAAQITQTSSAVAAVAPVVTTTTASTSQNNVVDTSTATAAENTAAVSNKNSYYFIPILLGLIILYGTTWTLSAKKFMRTLLHRKIWNMVLLVAVIVSALLGIFLVLNIDFNFNITLPFNMLFWHVEAGIALSIIALFHIVWHWKYFAKIVGKG